MARGYSSSGDLLPVTIDGIAVSTLFDEFQSINGVYNQTTDSIQSLFTTPTTDASDLIPLAIDGGEMELASEYGVPGGLRPKTSFLQVGFPLDWYEVRAPYTRAFLRGATAQQVRSLYNEALAADSRTIFKTILRTVFTPVSPANRPTNENSTPIFSLFDGGTDSNPPAYAGRTFAGAHQHYTTSGSTALDGPDLAFLIRNVTEHGYGSEPGDQVVVLVNPAELETIRGFRVANGSPFDFISSADAPAYLTVEHVVGGTAPSNFRGLPVAGQFGNALIIANDYIPAGFLTAVAVSSSRAPLAFRESANAAYRGFQLLPGSVPGAKLTESTYERGFGVGVRHRGAAACMQVAASATYTAPVI